MDEYDWAADWGSSWQQEWQSEWEWDNTWPWDLNIPLSKLHEWANRVLKRTIGSSPPVEANRMVARLY